ncbi:hypothetical protein RQP53_04030 [Paucibacter sp. APW11]|uniref:Uncharacterized protein n=1 Tax=Roseateles aquae TaxID=3077235 RepID=A0ABU3P9N3_9BURK|nr:hypothetical protein [Paucibacter sp. APW11]MDT8998441.1 hypothetical protein [Paucibacter sp. APW11]
MIIPLHLYSERAPAPLEFFDARHGDPRYLAALDAGLLPQQHVEIGLTVSGAVEGGELQRFAELMQLERLPLQPTRMIYDRLYAFERLAAAHASANPDLQAQALQLFDSYQARGEWIGLIH